MKGKGVPFTSKTESVPKEVNSLCTSEVPINEAIKRGTCKRAKPKGFAETNTGIEGPDFKIFICGGLVAIVQTYPVHSSAIV